MMFLYFSSFLIVIIIAFQGNFCCLIMHLSIPKLPFPPPPRQTPGYLTVLKNFGQIPLCCQFRRSNASPVRASKRVKSPTLQGKQNRLPLETSSAKFSATTNFLFSLSSLHALNKDTYHDITL